MKRPSFTLIFSGLFIAYVLHSIWSLANLFITPKCTKEPCLQSYLNSNPTLKILLYTSEYPRPSSKKATQILYLEKFDYDVSFER